MDHDNYNSIPLPARCYADFCLVPIGTGNASVADEVAAVQRLLKKSGLSYTMHAAGTTVGSWDQVMTVIGKAHTIVHQRGVVRVQSSIRAGSRFVIFSASLGTLILTDGIMSRTDKSQTAGEKVERVERLLQAEEDR
ncbi:hypothetical protein L249_2192 [Ophiocordyceps polyrhachis-furcata BCC 54312]|uniref:Thiamine-binding protein domain-containing protein n=1 Tax=Ophiocordyceps polyrhachis-furcata BCC 54312 TaxID=1330021 RepID=A0A367LNK4_9HYPO|nr:hypothetical protein L249_2192 [Ophiocordyceps polyrhachis-furcata BCC 54312]